MFKKSHISPIDLLLISIVFKAGISKAPLGYLHFLRMPFFLLQLQLF